MKKLEELGISPWPWTLEEWNETKSSDGDYVVCTDYGFYPPKTSDARLIAAAPELYEALLLCLDKMCVRCYAAEYAITGSVPCAEGCDVYKKAKYALLKAAGEEACNE